MGLGDVSAVKSSDCTGTQVQSPAPAWWLTTICSSSRRSDTSGLFGYQACSYQEPLGFPKKTDGARSLHLGCGNAIHWEDCPMPHLPPGSRTNCGHCWVDCSLCHHSKISSPGASSTGKSLIPESGSLRPVISCVVGGLMLPCLAVEAQQPLPPVQPLRPWSLGWLSR